MKLKKLFAFLLATTMVIAMIPAACVTAATDVYACDFDQPDALDGWAFYDADGDGYQWDLTLNQHDMLLGSNGSEGLCSASYHNDAGVLTPDNYAYSPTITLPESDYLTLSFAVGPIDAVWYKEYYSVYVVDTDGAMHELVSETVPAAKFTTRLADLTAFEGQNIRLAFRHHRSSDVFWLVLDDIRVYQEPASELIGDINLDGRLAMIDAFTLYRAVSGLTTLSIAQSAVANYDGQGEIAMMDAFSLYRTMAGLN